jgi:hypothetical protein
MAGVQRLLRVVALLCTLVSVALVGRDVAAQSNSPLTVCGMRRGAEIVRAPETDGEGSAIATGTDAMLALDVSAPAACPRAWHVQVTGGGAYYFAAEGVEFRKQGYPQLPTAGIFLDATFGFRLHRPFFSEKHPRVGDVFLFYRPGMRVQAHSVRLADPPGAPNQDGVPSSYRSLEVLQSRHLVSVQFGRGFQGTVTWSLGGFVGMHFRAGSRSQWNEDWRGNPPGDGQPIGQLFWVGREVLAAGATTELSFVLLSLGTVRMGLNMSADYYATDRHQWTGTVGPMLQFFPFRQTHPRLDGLQRPPAPDAPPRPVCPPETVNGTSSCSPAP